MMPGTATPGEMEQAMSMGLDVVKFFPAEQNGGVAQAEGGCRSLHHPAVDAHRRREHQEHEDYLSFR